MAGGVPRSPYLPSIVSKGMWQLSCSSVNSRRVWLVAGVCGLASLSPLRSPAWGEQVALTPEPLPASRFCHVQRGHVSVLLHVVYDPEADQLGLSWHDGLLPVGAAMGPPERQALRATLGRALGDGTTGTRTEAMPSTHLAVSGWFETGRERHHTSPGGMDLAVQAVGMEGPSLAVLALGKMQSMEQDYYHCLPCPISLTRETTQRLVEVLAEGHIQAAISRSDGQSPAP